MDPVNELTEFKHADIMRNAICKDRRCDACPISAYCIDIDDVQARDRIHDEYVKLFGPPEWESDWNKEPDLVENDVLSLFE